MKKGKQLKAQDNVSFRLAKDISQDKLDYLSQKKNEVPSFSRWCYEVFLSGLELELEKEKKDGDNQYTVFLQQLIPSEKRDWACNFNTRKMIGKFVYQVMFTDNPLTVQNEEQVSKNNNTKHIINNNAKNMLADLDEEF